jgi:diguanylate cyclase (GGDEF)-like protein/PAS domain S-box-containing protein
MVFKTENRERFLLETARQMREGLIAVDTAARVIYANPAALKMAGRAGEDVDGQDVQSVFPFISSEELRPLFPAIFPRGEEPAHFHDVVLHNKERGHIIADGCVARVSGESGGGQAGVPVGYVILARDTSDSKQLSALINHRDNCDAVTGLYNSDVFIARLEEVLEKNKDSVIPRALLYIDVDFFQSVDNTGGVGASAVLLRQAAALIRKNTGGQDFPGHLKKDDFAVILSDCSHKNANAVARRLMEAFRRHCFQHDGKRWAITISIGGLALNAKAGTAQEALDLAYSACREAYKKGGNRIAFVSAGKK